MKSNRLAPRSDAPPAEPGSAPPALHFHDVSVRFGEAVVLQSVDFDLEAGGFLVIVGPNGAGKSTLMKVALGLVAPNRGHAAIFGEDAGRQPDRIGYVPQLKTFERSFPASALELVVSGMRRSWPARIGKRERETALAALRDVGAEQLGHRALAHLSGGELQRAFLARALVRRPDIVLLDEPATGVDFLAEHDLYDLLDRYREETGTSVVMITHDLSAARYHAGKVLVLNRRVCCYGPPETALKESCLEEAFGHKGHGHKVIVL